jgi:hypothetical protein
MQPLQPLQRLPGSSISISSISAVQQAALRRLHQRAEHAEDLDAFEALVNGDLQLWESMGCTSFAAGMSLDLKPSTAQDQVCKVVLASALSLLTVLPLTPPQLIQEFRLALWLGRTLALPSEEMVSCKLHIEFKDTTGGRLQQLQVNQPAVISICSAAGFVALQALTSCFLCNLTWLSLPTPGPSPD